MKKFFYLLIVISSVPFSNAQGLKIDFTNQIEGKKQDIGFKVKKDESGNIYSTGTFETAADFDPDTGTYILDGLNLSKDIFLSKSDKSGKLIWAIGFGGGYSDRVNDMQIDSSGIYLTGAFSGVCDFDPSSGTFELRSYGTGFDCYIAKYSHSGKFLWAKEIGQDFEYEEGHGLVLDPKGYVYITGNFAGTTDFDPGSGTHYLTSYNSWDAFVLKLDKNGNFTWAKNFGDVGYSIALDKAGNIYTTGAFEGFSGNDFDPGTGTYFLKSKTYDYWDIFISKLSPAGDFIWAISMGENLDDAGTTISIDASNNIYCAGYFRGVVDFDPGKDSLKLNAGSKLYSFIAKYDSTGKMIWAKGIGGTLSTNINSITVDDKKIIYALGTFQGTTDFNPSTDSIKLTSRGMGDIFLLKLDSIGKYVWVRHMGGTLDDQGNDLIKYSSGDIYLTGAFSGTADMNPNRNVTNLKSAGDYDIFIQRIKEVACDTGIHSVSVSTCDFYISPSGKYKWTKSGKYLDTMLNNYGCDSIIGINLTIKPTTYGSISIKACNIFTSTNNRNIWTSSGIYKDTIVNMVGCDSIITVNLTILKTTIRTITAAECYKYTSPSKRNVWTVSGVYKDTIPNFAGCDSIITINLKIKKSTNSTISPTRCFAYLSPSKKHAYYVSGTYKDTVINVQGCDSFITINLIIKTIDIGVTNNNPTLIAKDAGANYQWLNCNTGYSIIIGALQQSFTASQNGSYAVRLIKSGCTDTSACYTVNKASIQKNNLVLPINFYPNPTSGELNVELGYLLNNAKISVINVMGVLVSSDEISGTSFKLKINEPPGIYLVDIKTSDGLSAVFKIVKY